MLKVEPTNPVGGRHALLHPAPGQAARPGRRDPAQGHRADGQGRQGEAAGRLLPDAGRRRERDAARRRRPAAGPEGPRRRAWESIRRSYELVQAKYLALVAAGEPAEALAFVEAKAKEDPKGPFRRLLVEKLREQKQYDRAEQLLAELHKEFPDESNLAAALVQVVSLQAAEAALAGTRPTGSASSMTGSRP